MPFVSILKPDPDRVVTEVYRKVDPVDLAEGERKILGFACIENVFPFETKMPFTSFLLSGGEDFLFQAGPDIRVLVDPVQNIDVLDEVSSASAQIVV